MEVCDGDIKQENADTLNLGGIQNNRKPSENGEPPLKIGEHYLVRRSDDAWHPAEIIQVRSSEQDCGKYEYYVHYDGCKYFYNVKSCILVISP
ncbi:histone acetyltransferase [Trichonephila clavipes]|nr:histone acetyltransferase [Trichonephila clavipes]